MTMSSETKENIWAAKVQSAVNWAVANRTQLLVGVGAVIAAVLVGSVFVLRRAEERDSNWTRLSQARAVMAQKAYPQAKEILTDIRAKAGSDAAGFHASFYLGEVALAEKNYDEAITIFSDVVARAGDSPIRPLALTNLAHAHEQKGDAAAAAKSYQQFLSDYPDHFLAPHNQLALGRNQIAAGDAESAKKSLTHLIDLYPTSQWAENSRRLLDKIPSR